MLRKAGAFSLLAFAAPMLTAGPAAADLPEILAGPRNPVPECVTPGRLTAYLRLRNPNLDSRYDAIATEYMRYGEMLGVRWDFAFYQMIVETGALSYWRGNRHGDVKPSQNNFAGLGATGKGERGESFPDIASGVRAHLEHLLLYAGRPVDNPIAQRTRNVQGLGGAHALAADVHAAHQFHRHVGQMGTGNKGLFGHAADGGGSLQCRGLQPARPATGTDAGGACVVDQNTAPPR